VRRTFAVLLVFAVVVAASVVRGLSGASLAQTITTSEQSRPTWFVQGLQEFERLSNLEKGERARQRNTLLRWARQHHDAFSCCVSGLHIQNARQGGAVFLMFLAQQFGDYVLGELQKDDTRSFTDALANQTRPYELSLLFNRFTSWLSSASVVDRPADQFIAVNGVRLQYVDWGGRGDVLLFLPGLGDDIHRFDAFAPHFANRWHVIGYSRRGQGASEKPATGYDTDTLVEDLRQFLDANRADTVDLIGHSLAGTEMTVFATRYPPRVHHIVYLDAAYDFAAGRDVAVKTGLPVSAGPSPIEQLDFEMGRNHLDFTKVRAPALAFFVLYDRPEDPPGIRPEYKLRPALLPYLREQAELFRRSVTRGEAVELRNTDHTFFNDPRIQASVIQRIKAFLQRP